MNDIKEWLKVLNEREKLTIEALRKLYYEDIRRELKKILGQNFIEDDAIRCFDQFINQLRRDGSLIRAIYTVERDLRFLVRNSPLFRQNHLK